MPVTLKLTDDVPTPAKHDSKVSPHILLRDSWENCWSERRGHGNRFVTLVKSSFDEGDSWQSEYPKMVPMRNGFVGVLTNAYGERHNLVIRPDDVWGAILAQLGHYMNAHANDMRPRFVRNEGSKGLRIPYGDRNNWDFGALAKTMTQMLVHDQVVDETAVDWRLPDFTTATHKDEVVDKTPVDWLLPNFSTTTHNDTVVAAAFLMSPSKEYFDMYREFGMACSIPSVTLDGEKADWENILTRLDSLEQSGEEPKKWTELLRPILRRFIRAFDGEADLEFWSKMIHVRSWTWGSDREQKISGWISAFYVWTEEGHWIGPRENADNPELFLDGVGYRTLDASSIPVGFCEMGITVQDTKGVDIVCTMVAGHVGSYLEGENYGTFRPLSAWFLFIKPEDMPQGHIPIFSWPLSVVVDESEGKNRRWWKILRTKILSKS